MKERMWSKPKKISQINVEFLHTPRDRIYFVADFLIIYWSQEEYDLDPATLNRMNFAYGIPTAPPLYLVEEAMEVLEEEKDGVTSTPTHLLKKW